MPETQKTPQTRPALSFSGKVSVTIRAASGPLTAPKTYSDAGLRGIRATTGASERSK